MPPEYHERQTPSILELPTFTKMIDSNGLPNPSFFAEATQTNLPPQADFLPKAAKPIPKAADPDPCGASFSR